MVDLGFVTVHLQISSSQPSKFTFRLYLELEDLLLSLSTQLAISSLHGDPDAGERVTYLEMHLQISKLWELRFAVCSTTSTSQPEWPFSA